MSETFRNTLAFIGLLLLAVWFLPLGEFLWNQLLVGERIHSTSILWFSWPGFAAWLYEAICFVGLGYLVHSLKLTPRPLLWAAVFGSCVPTPTSDFAELAWSPPRSCVTAPSVCA